MNLKAWLRAEMTGWSSVITKEKQGKCWDYSLFIYWIFHLDFNQTVFVPMCSSTRTQSQSGEAVLLEATIYRRRLMRGFHQSIEIYRQLFKCAFKIHGYQKTLKRNVFSRCHNQKSTALLVSDSKLLISSLRLMASSKGKESRCI